MATPSDTRPGDDNGFEPKLRLYQGSWLFGVLAYLKTLIVPLVVASLLGSSDRFAEWVPFAALIPLLAASLWQQWLYRYGFSPRGLVIREGLLFRNLRTIDYRRIENIDTERGVLHRMLGVAEVRIETSTGGGAEARIRVLEVDAVDTLRERIFAQRRALGQHLAAPSPAAQQDGKTTDDAAPLLHLPPRELILLGLIDNRGMLIVAAVLGVLGQSGFFERLDTVAEGLFATLPWDSLTRAGVVAQALLVFAAAIVLIVATRVLSVGRALLLFFDFTLTRRGEDLQARYGLLTRVSLTMRRQRIQAVHQTATLLHRLCGRVSLRVDLAGGVGTDAQQRQQGAATARERWLAPVCVVTDAERLVRAALPNARIADSDWQTLAPRARWRIFRVLLVAWLALATLPSVVVTGWWSLAILPAALPFFWMHAWLYVRYTSWVLHERSFVMQRGWLTRKLSVIPRDRVQSVHLHESPFDRRQRMLRLEVDTAGSSRSHRLTLPYLDRDVARALAAALTTRIGAVVGPAPQRSADTGAAPG